MDIVEAIKASPQLMNMVFDQLHTAIFIVDEQFKVIAFNPAFQQLSGREEALIVHQLCGNVLGCVYSDGHKSPCGSAVFCQHCDLRKAIQSVFSHTAISDPRIVEREFVHAGELTRKYLRYMVKAIVLEGVPYALLLVDDVTAIEEQKASVLTQNAIISKLNAKFQRDLAMAKRVQDNIIPKQMLRLNDYVVDFRYLPLEAIGGDMFDLYILDHHRIGVLMCDVVGHGLPAALITTMIKALIEGSKHLLEHPKAFMRNLNRKLMSILGEVYLSAIYGIFDTAEHTFTFVRAGHPKPWILKRGEISEIGNVPNMMLGVDESFLFLDEVYTLERDEILLLYTDGLMEAKIDHSLYETHLKAIVKKWPLGGTQSTAQAIERDLREWVSPSDQADDICFLLIGRQQIG